MPFLSQKTDAMIFFIEIKVLNFSLWGNAYGVIAVIVAWIQQCGEATMFHLQSHWSPKTRLLPSVARNTPVSFCDHPLNFWAPSVRTIFCTVRFLSQFHELCS